MVVRVQTRILQAISEWKRPVEGKEFGSVGRCDRAGVSGSVELERRWSVGGLHRHFPVANLYANRLGRADVARMFQKTGWSERWYSRIVHTARTLGRIAMPRSHRQSEMERTIKDCWECGKMDCGRAGWSVDFHFSPCHTKERNWGEFEAVLMEIQEFVSGRPKQHVILGGDFNASLYGMTD